MWINGIKRVEVKVELDRKFRDCQSSFIRMKGKLSSRKILELTPLKLFTKMARGSIIPSHPFFLLGQGFLHFLNFCWIFENQGTELKLRFDPKKIWSDFNQSSLSGNLGQAISLIYMEENGFYWNSHFSEIAQVVNVNNTCNLNKPGKPDYILRNKDGEMACVESKGSVKWEVDINELWGQTGNNGFKSQVHPWIGSSLNKKSSSKLIRYGYCVGSGISRNGTEVYVVKSTDDATARKSGRQLYEFDEALYRLHYARWLLLMGLLEEANCLVNEQVLESRELYYSIRVGIVEFVFPRLPFFTYQLDIAGTYACFGLEKSLAEFLFGASGGGQGNFGIVDEMPSRMTQISNTYEDDEEIEIFKDGSIATTNGFLRSIASENHRMVRWNGNELMSA